MSFCKQKNNRLNQPQSVTSIPLAPEVKATSLNIKQNFDCPPKAREALQGEWVRLVEDQFVIEVKKGKESAH